MVAFFTLVLLFALRRQTESDIRIEIIEKALTLAGTDVEKLTRDYVDDTINKQTALARRMMRTIGPYKYRHYISP